MLKQYDFLSPEECTRMCEIVLGLKEFWVERRLGFLPFYTLGAASYLDCTEQSDEAYFQAAEKYNSILSGHFPLLYEHLTERLSEILGQPAAYAEGMGMPGFQIFLSSKAFEYPMASTHFDLQYQKFKRRYDQVDLEHPISFTCLIGAPKSGSGIYYWNITREEAQNLSNAELEALKAEREKIYFPYKLGALVVHHSIFLHQIAPSKDSQTEDYRITLQGHGLLCDQVMRLYW